MLEQDKHTNLDKVIRIFGFELVVLLGIGFKFKGPLRRGETPLAEWARVVLQRPLHNLWKQAIAKPSKCWEQVEILGRTRNSRPLFLTSSVLSEDIGRAQVLRGGPAQQLQAALFSFGIVAGVVLCIGVRARV